MPLTLYVNGSGGLLERMKATGVDVVRWLDMFFMLSLLELLPNNHCKLETAGHDMRTDTLHGSCHNCTSVKHNRPDDAMCGQWHASVQCSQGSISVLMQVGLDWTVDMQDARMRLGNDVALQGNVDPTVLFTTQVRG